MSNQNANQPNITTNTTTYANNNKVYYGEYSLKHWVDLILSGNIVLPPYQRYYVLQEEKLDKLIDSFRNNYFVPPIVIGAKQDKNGKNENIVIDGQQRLTNLLLAYLGIYLDENNKKPKFEVTSSQDLDDLSESNENIIEWKFTDIQNLGKNAEEIKHKINEQISNKTNKEKKNNNNSESEKQFNYKLKPIENLEWDKIYLGFCYLIPQTSTLELQQQYYTSVFRLINTQGKPLLPQESREALYYQNETFASFFSPDFLKENKITLNNTLLRIDFVHYLALLAQYAEVKNKTNEIARGYKTNMEEFYEEYIYSIILDDKNKKFIKFNEIYPNNKYQDDINYLSDITFKILPREFGSIIDLDIYFFGLVHFVIFNHKRINEEKIKELKTKIVKEIGELKKQSGHSKSPNSLSNLRIRMKKSIEIYGEYFNV